VLEHEFNFESALSHRDTEILSWKTQSNQTKTPGTKIRKYGSFGVSSITQNYFENNLTQQEIAAV
jgi:hypothetical protein